MLGKIGPTRAHLHETQPRRETSRVCCSRGQKPSRRCAGRSRARKSRAGATGRRKNCTQCDYNHSLRVDLGQKDQIARTCTRHSQDEPRRADFVAARAAEIRAADVRVVHVRVRPAQGRLKSGGATLSTVSTTLFVSIWGQKKQIVHNCTRHSQKEPRRAEFAARGAEIRDADVRVVHVRVRPARGRLGGGGATLSTISTTHYVLRVDLTWAKHNQVMRNCTRHSRDEPR